MRRQLDFERQQTLQAEETRRQIEEQRLFEEWQRERAAGGLSLTRPAVGRACACGAVSSIIVSGDWQAMRRILVWLRRGVLALLLVLLTFLGVRAWDSERGPPLEIWHTYIPEELSVDALDRSAMGRLPGARSR